MHPRSPCRRRWWPCPPRPITRTFSRCRTRSAEARDARVYAGIHFREGCKAGVHQGTQVARFVTGHALRPTNREGNGKESRGALRKN